MPGGSTGASDTKTLARLRRVLVELALQRAAVHFQRARGGRDVAVVLVQHFLDVFPFEPRHGQRFGADFERGIGLVAQQRGEDLVGVRGFREVVPCAEAHRLDRGGDAGITGEHDDGRGRGPSGQRGHDGQPRFAGQFQIDHGVGGIKGIRCRPGLDRIVRHGDLETALAHGA